MDNPATPTPEPTQPDPDQDRTGPTVLGRLAAVLQVVRGLLGYGRHLATSVPARAKSPEFATVAGVFGTYNLPLILARVQRGILRAIALERYLLARAAAGQDIDIVKRRVFGYPIGFTDDPDPAPRPSTGTAAPLPIARPRTSPPRPAPSETLWLDPDHPAAFRVYTFQELEAQVRRLPLGQTIVEICNDLGVIPSFCTGEFWNAIHNVIWWYGGSYAVYAQVRERRREAFQRERGRRSETCGWNWRDTPKDLVRRVLGYLIGEAPLPGPPGPLLATAPP